MRRFGFLAFLLPLAACNTPNPAEIAVSCPIGAVLAQAATITKLAPAGNPPASVIVTAEITQPRLTCDYDNDANEVAVNLTIPISVTRGAAGANAGAQNLSYFVAVVDPAGTMITKRIFNRTVQPGAGGDSLNEYVNGTNIRMPTGRRPGEYQVLTGFQLTPAELAYNQRQRNFRP
jgi:hypothetical protein